MSMSWWWLRQFEQAFDESIQELGVDMDEVCDNGTYPKARDHLVDTVESIVLRMRREEGLMSERIICNDNGGELREEI